MAWVFDTEALNRPKGNIGARQGLINRATKGRKSSQTKGNNAGRAPSIRVACPQCPMVSTAQNPEGYTYVSIGWDTKRVRCKQRHVFMVGGSSRPSTDSIVLEA